MAAVLLAVSSLAAGCGASAAPASPPDVTADSASDTVIGVPDSAADASTTADMAVAASDSTASPPADATADAAPATEVSGPVTVFGPQDPTQLPAAPMADITAQFGLDPVKTHSPCVGAGDLDGNGRDDMLVIEIAKTDATIHAILLGDGPPQHVWTPFDTSQLLPTTGCSLVDMDGDGQLDLLAGGHAGAALYLGNGKGGFADHSQEWLPYIMDFATLTLTPADLDGDGDLDVMVGAGVTPVNTDGSGPACGSLQCSYLETDFVCSMKFPFPEAPAELQDRVLIRGETLPMVDATESWNVPAGGIWSNVMAADVDLDGKVDVLVGDDFGAHRLLHNQGNYFKPHDIDIGFHSYGHGMGWGIGDFNADGKPDLVMADAGPNPVFVQATPAAGKAFAFTDEGGSRGVWNPTWTASTWSPLVADFDHDGRDDLTLGVSIATTGTAEFPDVATGCMGMGGKMYAGHPNPDLLLLSAGSDASFTVSAMPSGPWSHFAMVTQVTLDLDGDGDLDLLQTRPNANMTASVRVMRNDVPKKGGHFWVRLQGKGGNRDAVGARITAKIGGFLRTRWLTGSGGTGGTRTRVAHFGLGTANQASEVTVHWPDGKTTAIGEVQAGATATADWP
jgi:hypothetical protein